MFHAVRMRCGYLTLLICLLVGLSACAPDLQPEAVDGLNGPICDFEGSIVAIRVRNEGSDAAASVTAVQFSHSSNAVKVATPPIATKSGTALRVPIPKPVPSPPEVRFDIVVDADNAIVESNESNNTVIGGDCTPGIGP